MSAEPDIVLQPPADISAAELRDVVLNALPPSRLRDLFERASQDELDRKSGFEFSRVLAYAALAGVAAVPGPARPGSKP